MTGIAITFTPDGTGHALYTEAIDLADIGPLAIRRATRIEFDNDCSMWRVYDAEDNFPLFTAPTRSQCLTWERLYLDQQEDRKHELSPGARAVTAGA